jgi:hypothetical protein
VKFKIHDCRVTAPIKYHDAEGCYDALLARAICEGQRVSPTFYAGGSDGKRPAFHHFRFVEGKVEVTFDLASREVTFDLASRELWTEHFLEIEERIRQSQRWLSNEMSRLAKLREDLAVIEKGTYKPEQVTAPQTTEANQ